MSDAIYDPFNPADNYDALAFRPDKRLQSRELNELQSMLQHRLRSVAEAFFRDGDIVRDARCSVDAATGQAQLEAGALYVDGAVRGILPATLSVATTGKVVVGAYLVRDTITELEEPGLRNPAVGTRGYMEPGAWRYRAKLTWGVQGDGSAGDFFPIWEIIDGAVRPRDAAPQVSAINQALAQYDRDSSGGTYAVSGLHVTQLPDREDGAQMYSIAAGHARVGGYAVAVPAARLIALDTAPDVLRIDSEPHNSTTEGTQRIHFDRPPMVGTPEVRVQSRKTVNIVHGGFTGVADPLPDAAVIVVEEVKQGGTTYSAGPDYVFTAGQLDWSPGGAEPAPGTTYSVTYQHIRLAVPSDVTADYVEVAGALPGTLVQLTYDTALRRIDRLVLTSDGDIQGVRGMPDPYLPATPAVPDNTLALASIHQSWDGARRLVADGVRLVPMPTLEAYDTRLDQLRLQMAELRLSVSMAGRYSGIMRGQFADPMQDDGGRDAGQPQTAFIGQGWLQLRAMIDATPVAPSVAAALCIDHSHAMLLQQPLITGAMRINPSDMPSTRPTALNLTPPVDRWSEKVNVGVIGGSSAHWILINATSWNDVIKHQIRTFFATGDDGMIRQIEVRAAVQGFNAGETIAQVLFAGRAATPEPVAAGSLQANAAGEAAAKFTIPADVPTGTVEVVLVGSNGSKASALFTGEIERTYEGQLHYAARGAIGVMSFKDITL